MKYVLFLLILAPLLSCDSTDERGTLDPQTELKDNFTISGTIQNGQNLMFYLEAQTEKGVVSVAKVKSDGTGKFKLVGNIPGFGIYQLRMGETPEKVIPLTLLPNDNIRIEATYADFFTPTVTGSSWTGAMTKYMKLYQAYLEGRSELELNPDQLSNDELNKRFSELKVEIDTFSLNQMRREPGNPFNYILLASAFPQGDYNSWDPKNLDLLKSVEAALAEKFPDSPLVEKLGYQVYQIDLEYDKYLNMNSGTQPVPEIALPNPNGKTIRLSDLKGKIVLIDFWASWCGPCRKENPTVVRLYNKYKDKGFTVFSVSLDENADLWKAAIASDGLSWPNHCSDLLGWSSPVIQDYGFNGIPHTVLLNREGNVIGLKLRGAELEQKLEELFAK